MPRDARGFYSPPGVERKYAGTTKPGFAGLVAARPDLPNVLHEYAHRLQATVPGLDDRFQALHRARTAGDPVEALYPDTPGETGRRDKYVEACSGREYTRRGGALEVLAMAFQQLLADPPDDRPNGQPSPYRQLLSDDPEMAALAVCLLMRYDPDP